MSDVGHLGVIFNYWHSVLLAFHPATLLLTMVANIRKNLLLLLILSKMILGSMGSAL